MKRISNALPLILLMSSSVNCVDQDVSVKIINAVEDGAYALADAVEHSAHAAKDFVHYNKGKAAVLVHRAEAKAAEKEAHATWKETQSYEVDAQNTRKTIEQVRQEIKQEEQKIERAKEERSQAQEALYNKENLVPVVLQKNSTAEGFVDKVSEAGIATKDLAVNGAQATKEAVVGFVNGVAQAVKDVPQAAKVFVADTVAKADTVVQEARVKHAHERADKALRGKEKIEDDLARLLRKKEVLQEELAVMHRQTELAQQALIEAQRVALIRSQLEI